MAVSGGDGDNDDVSNGVDDDDTVDARAGAQADADVAG